MKKVVFEVETLCIAYGERPVIDNLSFTALAGELTCLFGPNRAGKSSIIRALAGIMKIDAGTIRLHEARANVGVCLQFPEHLFYRDSVLQEAIGLVGDEASARSVLASVNLSGAADRSPFTLSEGQKRLLVVASLAATSPVIILDEPFAGLDPVTGASLGSILRLAADRGAAVIYTANRKSDTAAANVIVSVPRLADAGAHA